MKLIPLDERAVSTIIGFLLVLSATVSVTGYLVATKGQMAQRRAEGMIDVMDKAQERQGQLVSLSYSDKQGANTLEVYVSNYGWQDVKIKDHPEQPHYKAVWVNGNPVHEDDFQIYNPLKDKSLSKIPGRSYVRLRVSNVADTDTYSLTFLTKTDIVFTWEVHPR